MITHNTTKHQKVEKKNRKFQADVPPVWCMCMWIRDKHRPLPFRPFLFLFCLICVFSLFKAMKLHNVATWFHPRIPGSDSPPSCFSFYIFSYRWSRERHVTRFLPLNRKKKANIKVSWQWSDHHVTPPTHLTSCVTV